jgi:predicted porin
MNKKLVALAVAGLLAAPLAQAQTANVTLYGRISIDLELVNYDGPKGSNTVGQVNSISSRWGLRGSEALGGGMNAIFQCETPMGVDSGASGVSAMCGREGWVGLNGKWGELKLGYGLTPYDDVKGFTDFQGSNSYENPNNGVSSGPGFAANGLFTNYGAGQAVTNSGAFDARYGNSISYLTPTYAGWSLRTQYAFIDESPSQEITTINGQKQVLQGQQAFGWDTRVIYANGPATFGLTYAYHGNFSGLGGDIKGLNDQQAWRLAGKWNFGNWLLAGYWDQAKYKFQGDQIPVNVAIPLTYKYQNWSLGAQYFMGPWTFGAQYNWRNNGLANAYNGFTNTYTPQYVNLTRWNQGGGEHVALTSDYALSKRTTLRMYYAWMQNEGTELGNLAVPNFQGKSSVWALSGGLWHTF